MEYILNKLPVKTTNNFKVNDLKIDLDLPVISDFKDFSISNNKDIIIEKRIVSEEISSRIGLTFDKYLELNIVVPKNKKMEDTIILEYDFSNDDNLVDKININYEDNSSCNFIIIYKSIDNNKHFHYLVENTKSNNNSLGSITYINLLNDKSSNFISIENDSLDNSVITHNIIDISSGVKVNNMYSNVYNNASNYLNNIYLGFKEDIIDMNYYLNNIGKNSKNIMRVEGVLDDNARKTFRGTIDFIEGSSDSIGDENENCVLLSDKAVSRSLPQMLCHEENVVGAHGVSSGKIDTDKLFYLMAHGYSEKEAEKLIVMANLSKIINNINDENIRNMVLNIIEEKIS